MRAAVVVRVVVGDPPREIPARVGSVCLPQARGSACPRLGCRTANAALSRTARPLARSHHAQCDGCGGRAVQASHHREARLHTTAKGRWSLPVKGRDHPPEGQGKGARPSLKYSPKAVARQLLAGKWGLDGEWGGRMGTQGGGRVRRVSGSPHLSSTAARARPGVMKKLLQQQKAHR